MTPERHSAFVDSLEPLLLGRLGDLSVESTLVFDPLDSGAWRTLGDTWTGARGSLRAFGQAIRSVVHPPRPLPAPLLDELRRHLRPGMVIMVRSQKIIVLDRRRQVVFILLRPEQREQGHLLRYEITAGQALPAHTVPVLASRLDRQPLFVAQRYRPFRPVGNWRALRPVFDRLVDVLWRYYQHFGLEEEAEPAYLARLEQSIRDGLAAVGDPAERQRTELAFARILEACDREGRRLGHPTVHTVQSHGDFIASHVVRPSGEAPDHFLLVDWSESHRYSLFYDLFYFQFQNQETDFMPLLLSGQSIDPWSYFGTGYRRLSDLVLGPGQPGEAEAQLRWRMLVGLLEALDQRLHRLHPRYLRYWADQAGALPS